MNHLARRSRKESKSEPARPDDARACELALTNSRVWVSVPPPFRPKSVISFPNDRRAISVPDGGFGAPRLMSTNNRIRVMIGLSVLGSFGWATVRDHANADEPRDANAPSAVVSSPPERYLMLTNGQMIKGAVTDEDKEFVVVQRAGPMRFPKQRVAGAFDSMQEAYQYHIQQLPDRDCEERMKLAQWCLNMKLHAEAKEQLEKVLELNSKHPQARSMMFTMEQAAAMAAQRRRDPEVKQTGAEETEANHPGALDSAVIQKAQRQLNISGLPVIFDLPTPLAIRRTQEFTAAVHPLLQVYCARCHDGNSGREFQLVPMKNRADRTQDALRANLDATLRLIDQENPAKSELLTASLRPHGNGGRKRAIFPGSNDKAYQVLSAWAQSLRHPQDVKDAARAQAARNMPENGETFAAARPRVGGDGLEDGLPELPAARRPPVAVTPPASRIPPPSRFVPAGAAGPDVQNQGAPDDFPLPFAVTGKKPNLALPDAESGPASKSSRTNSSALPAAPARAGVTKPGSPADAIKTGDQAKAGVSTDTAKKKRKPVTIDPALLERALQNRNADR
jgi:hypothetical protein